MKSQCFIILSALSLSACTAHVGYNDIGAALRSGFSKDQPNMSAGYVPQKASPQDCAFHSTAKAAQDARSSLSRYKNNMAAAKQALSQNPAWQNGSCIRPAMRNLPPRPKGLSHEEVEFQAIGSCVDLAGRRQGMNDLAQALVAVRQEKLMAVADKWRSNHQEPCALAIPQSQVDDFVARAVCGAFGREAYSACIMQNLQKCAQTVVDRCEAPLAVWKQNVEAIQNEPDVLVQQCQESLRVIEGAERNIPGMEMTAQFNQEEHDKLAASGGARVPASACH